MLPYDSRRNYFGAENTRLAEIFGNVLELLPAIRDGWNYAAYNHDDAYSGKKKTGFFAPIINFCHRRSADNIFRRDLEDAVYFAANDAPLSQYQIKRALQLANISHKAVRALGWKFYKTG